MKIVVTDLTRMRAGHICVAGIDPDTGARVRPVSGQLSSILLRRHRGPFDIRAIVDLGSCRPAGRPPEIEDVWFEPSTSRHIGEVPPDDFYQLCRAGASVDLSAIGPALTRFGKSLVTDEGHGDCSLVLVATSKRPKVFIDNFDKLRFRFSNEVELSVTDVRLYREDLVQPDVQKLRLLRQWLSESDESVLSFGLGRAWQHPDDDRPRHYLQLNNIHLKTHPGWQLQ
jgi:hypothetical protein